MFTQRTETVADHRGQISLPGGSREPHDPDLEATALRESQEELGVPANDVHVLGRLEDVYVSVSNFLISPFVGALDYAPTFLPDPREVACIIEVPLDQLRDPGIFHEEEWLLRDQPRLVQFYQHGQHQIWGATGRVIQQFLASAYPDLLATRFRSTSSR